jgi:hypothetical protein
MQIKLTDAIMQLRDELREAILEGENQDIVFTPRGIEMEFAITFGSEVSGKGGAKLLAFLDLSAEAKASGNSQHRVKLTLDVADKNGDPLKVRSQKTPGGL